MNVERGKHMSKKQYVLVAMLAFIGGLVGGISLNSVLINDTVFAQRESEWERVPLDLKIESIKKLEITEKEWNYWNISLREIGRFQLEGRVILDTKLGHSWMWGKDRFVYVGRVFPGKEWGERFYRFQVYKKER